MTVVTSAMRCEKWPYYHGIIVSVQWRSSRSCTGRTEMFIAMHTCDIVKIEGSVLTVIEVCS